MEVKQENTALTLMSIIFTGIGALFSLIGTILVISFFRAGDQTAAAFMFIFVGIGLIFAAIGILIFISVSKGKQERARLISEGIRFPATVTNFYMNTSLTVNGRHPYIAECVYTNAYGENVLVKSKNLWPAFIPQPENLEALVYVDRSNPRKYSVSITVTDSLSIAHDYR